MSKKSLQGCHTPGSHDECRTATDGRQRLDQAHGLEPLARLQAAKKLHPPLPSLVLTPKLILILPFHRGQKAELTQMVFVYIKYISCRYEANKHNTSLIVCASDFSTEILNDLRVLPLPSRGFTGQPLASEKFKLLLKSSATSSLEYRLHVYCMYFVIITIMTITSKCIEVMALPIWLYTTVLIRESSHEIP